MSTNEITELQSVDFAVGAVIAHAFDSFAAEGPANWQSFLARPYKGKIIRMTEEDMGEATRKVANAQKGDGTDGKPQFPYVMYFRRLGFNNGDEKARRMNRTVWNDAELKALKLSALPVSLDYFMAFIARDKPTLEKMQIAWAAYISQPARKNSRFVHPTQIAEEIWEVPANFLDPRTVMFSDASPDKNETGRTYAVSTEFTINTEVLVGESVTPLEELTVVGLTSSYLCGVGTV